MITIAQTVATKVILSLNQRRVSNNDTVDVVFTSPSRPTLTFEKALTDRGGGFFSFTILESEGAQLIDNTYIYSIVRNGEELKIGKVRIEDGELFGLDYINDFELA